MDFLQNQLIQLKQMGFTEQHLAYGSTLLISIAPFLILFLFRLENTSQHRNKLRLALSFASGGLLGDAFLHLIPHSMSPHHHHHDDHHHGHDHDHHHQHHGDQHKHEQHHDDHHHHHHDEHKHGHDHFQQTMVGLYIISGIILFFIIEKFVHMVKGHDHHHHQHHDDKKKRKEKVSDSEDEQGGDDRKKLMKKSKPRASENVSQTRLVSGILNLIADFLHNFTDGLAIGATFATGGGMGTITAITILLHEIPHEIGDYAILIQAGYRRRNAIALQLVTAVGAMLGTYVGLHYGSLEHATQFILPITAGGFIYIATINVLPELLEGKTTHRQTFYELLGLFTGIGMMFWIALNE